MRYVFADCLLDTQLYTLSRAGRAIPLRPKAFHVLRYLLEHRDHLVSKEELCAHVWPAQFISDATIEGCIKRARQAIGDTGRAQQLIQTRRGYGYRFVGAVEERPEAPPTQAPTGTLRLVPAAPTPDDTPRQSDPARRPGEDSMASGAGAMSPAPRSSLAPRTAPAAPIQDGIVKLLGIIWSPGNRRYFPDVIATDPPFRRPALSPLFQPNSRIAAASLCGTPARTADAVWGGSVGQWGHTRTRIAGHALLT